MKVERTEDGVIIVRDVVGCEPGSATRMAAVLAVMNPGRLAQLNASRHQNCLRINTGTRTDAERRAIKAARYAICPCGSGKKFKFCCGRHER